MGLKVDGKGFGDGWAVGNEVVETLVPGVVLQLVDHCKTAIVQHQNDQLFLTENRGIDVRIHHHVGPVADKDDGVLAGFLFGLRDTGTPGPRNLIAHAAKAELDIHGALLKRAPVGGDLGGQPTGGSDHTVAFVAKGVHGPDGHGVGIGAVARGHVVSHIRIPLGTMRLRVCHPARWRAISRKPACHCVQGQLGVAHDRQGHVFARVMAPCVDRDKPRVFGKGRPGACGEVLQSRADSHDHIRFFGNGIGTVGACHPNRADIQRMGGPQIGAAGNGLHHGNLVGFGKFCKLGHGAGILHAAACDDHRFFGCREQGDRIRHLCVIRRLATDPVHFLLEPGGGIVIGPALHILRQTDEGRAAVGGVQHGGNGIGQRLDNLRRMGDPIPITHNGLEGVIHAKGRIAKVLHLLQDRIGQAGDVGVAAQHQHRQAVCMGQRGTGKQVRCPRARAGCTEHKALAQPLFGKSGSRKAHTLFVLAAIEGECVAHIIQGLAQAGDVAMAKDAKAAAAQPPFLPIDFYELVGQPADDRLGRGQPECCV
mmetsp:Transcript_7235/g.12045  ORF Transcript_7235/g.12045 Transcript_7235/m.12045 type:complete len:538 (+) Transcript_7235:1195-2808(+)